MLISRHGLRGALGMTMLVLLGAAGLAAADTEQEVDAFFQAFREKRDGIESLQATFVQRTFLPQEVITTEGALHYSRPRRILFATKDPERSILVDARRGYEYDAEIRQITIFDIEDHPRANIFFLGFDDDTEALKTAYNLTLFDTEDDRGRQGVKIEPRQDSDEAVYFMEANLYLRDEDFLPYRIHIVNDRESQLFIDVTNIVKRPEKDLESARILVPEGVKVVENDRVIETVGEAGRQYPADDRSVIIEERELPAAPLTPVVPAE